MKLYVLNLITGQTELAATLAGAGPFGAFSSDSAYLVTGAGRTKSTNGAYTYAYIFGDIQVWDTSTGKEIFSRNSVVNGVVFSPDSKLLACPLQDRTLKVFDLKTGHERATMAGHSVTAHDLAFSPDGRFLATASDNWDKAKNGYTAGEIKIWDVQTGKEHRTLRGDAQWIRPLVFSPDGRCLVSGSEGKTTLWDFRTGEKLLALQLAEYVYRLTFSADGARLIGWGSRQEQDDTVHYWKMWNTQTGQELLSFKSHGLDFTPDGKRVVATDWDKSRMKVFDAESGQQVMNIPDDGTTAFSPDSKRLASHSKDGMRIWDLETGDEVNFIRLPPGERLLEFTADGKRLVVTGRGRVSVWDVETEQQSKQTLTLHGVQRGSGHSISDTPALFSSDFTRLAGISGKTIRIFDAQDARELRKLAGHDNNIVCLAFSADGKRLATSDGRSNVTPGVTIDPGTVKVWDVGTGNELFTIQGHERAITHLAFSPDGRKLAGSPEDRTAKVWNATTGELLFSLGTPSQGRFAQGRLAFSPDGKRLACYGKIWDADTGEEIVSLQGGTFCHNFSPDGKRLIAAVRGSPVVFDAQTGEVIFALEGYDDHVTFSPDGKRLASAGKIWDAQTGQQLLDFGQRISGGQVAFSSDGHRLGVVRHNDGIVTIYDATPLPEKP
jgi:WD40 repeat protein